MADDELARPRWPRCSRTAARPERRRARRGRGGGGGGESRRRPAPRAAWADAFGTARARRSTTRRRAGCAYASAPTPVLARLPRPRATADAGRGRVRAALAELAMAAASLGELTISALATATVIGNAQLAAAGDDLRRRPATRCRARHTPTGRRPGRSPAPRAARRRRRRSRDADAETEPPPSLEELLAELDALVGLEAVKTEVRHQTQLLRIQALRGSKGLRNPDLTRHLVFVGNPGTGKTTVARLVAGIYRAVGLLPKGHLVECDRSELVAGYVGPDRDQDGRGDRHGARRRAVHRRGLRARRRRLRQRGDRHAGEGDGGPPRRAARDRRRLPGADGDVHHLQPRAREPVPAHAGRSTTTPTTSWSRSSPASRDGADFTPTPEAFDRAAGDARGPTPRDEGFGNGRFVRNLFESAIVRQAWRLRDVTDPDVEQLRELRAEDLVATLDEPHPADAPAPTRRRPKRARHRRCHHHDQPVTTPPPPPPPVPPGAPPPAPPAAPPEPCTHAARELLAGAVVGHARAHARVRGDRDRVRASCSASGLPGAVARFHSDLDDARDNAEQLVRIQAIRTNLVKADANATNAFLVGGLEPPAARDAYTDGITTTARDARRGVGAELRRRRVRSNG